MARTAWGHVRGGEQAVRSVRGGEQGVRSVRGTYKELHVDSCVVLLNGEWWLISPPTFIPSGEKPPPQPAGDISDEKGQSVAATGAES